MKIAILTSDIPDGKIITSGLINSGLDVRAVIYQNSKQDLKSCLKLFWLYANRKVSFWNFQKLKNKINVLKTDDINGPRVIKLLQETRPDIIISAGTPKLKKEIFGSSRYSLNIHSGILPFYRGADSEFWAIFNNEPDVIGVSLHLISDKIDQGPIIFQIKQAIRPDFSLGRLRINNIFLAASILKEAITGLWDNRILAYPQSIFSGVTYFSHTKKDKQELDKKNRLTAKKNTVEKVFSNGEISARERVVKYPLNAFTNGQKRISPRFFCLRIDADEYHPDTFNYYFSIFKKHKEAITVFFNINSFRGADEKISVCQDAGLDIQSHAYYHHIYNDYRNNLENIKRADTIFRKIGISPIGFAAPMGKWNPNLISALEKSGYRYSSDFCYDYLGLPSYPVANRRFSSILEIPVFPVSPELFYLNENPDPEKVIAFYKNAINLMDECGLPVIIYAHTGSSRLIPEILEEILGYAIKEKRLVPVTMTSFYYWWLDRHKNPLPENIRSVKQIPEGLLGKEMVAPASKRMKYFLKELLDYEKITPINEIRYGGLAGAVKRIIRSIKQ